MMIRNITNIIFLSLCTRGSPRSVEKKIMNMKGKELNWMLSVSRVKDVKWVNFQPMFNEANDRHAIAMGFSGRLADS